MTATAPEAPAATYREHTAAENAAGLLATDTAAYGRAIGRHYGAMQRHMDPIERTAVLAFAEEVTAFEVRMAEFARKHHRAAERADQ